MKNEQKETSKARRAGAAAGLAIMAAGALLILLCFGLLIFGGKAEGRLVKKESLSRGKYRFTYVYTVDGQDCEFRKVRKVRHSADDEAFKTQKISYLPSAPSFACTEDKFGWSMLLGIIGLYVWLFSKHGEVNKSRKHRTEKSPQWNNYLNKVKSGGNKQE